MNASDEPQHGQRRVLLLMTPATYRARAFRDAAQRAGVTVVQGIDMPKELAEYWHVRLGLDFSRPAEAVAAIVASTRAEPLAAILSVDDSASELAALASAALGLPHNSPQSATAARDKFVMRRLLHAAGVPAPQFWRFALTEAPAAMAAQVEYPCVVKPLRLSGSRGVIRANDPAECVAAVTRLKRLLLAEGNAPEETHVLIERFIPGFEVALEGILTRGELQVLALFDKPDPLDGPFFEETIYVTPSRLPEATQAAIAVCTERAAAALGLRTGPVHAELRVNAAGPWIVEIAGRSIGGLCSTILQFGTNMMLEELILRHAVGEEIAGISRDGHAVGVMMIPIPHSGMLRGYSGCAEASAVAGITGIEITAKLHAPIVALPEGASYLGFIFARGEDPAWVEARLREAHACLRFDIAPQLPVIQPAGG
jgi:biotin carboxylase